MHPCSKCPKLNRKGYNESWKLMEKYNVEDTSKLGGGGEYPGQDGFGWTNSVFLQLSQ
jgi:alpha,alpha-trehalase